LGLTALENKHKSINVSFISSMQNIYYKPAYAIDMIYIDNISFKQITFINNYQLSFIIINVENNNIHQSRLKAFMIERIIILYHVIVY